MLLCLRYEQIYAERHGTYYHESKIYETALGWCRAALILGRGVWPEPGRRNWAVTLIGVFDWAIGHELIFWSSHFLIRLVPVTKQLHDRGYFVLTGQKGPVT